MKNPLFPAASLAILALTLTLPACASTSAGLTPAQQAEAAEKKLRGMSLSEVRDECETPTVSSQKWFANHQLKIRYTTAACQRASILEQRRWFKTIPCDELRRRLFDDVPYRPDVPSARTLRLRLWQCNMHAVYFDRLDLELVVNKPSLTTAAMTALAGAGHKVVEVLLGYVSSSHDPFGKLTAQGGIYNAFRGIGVWLGNARPTQCFGVAQAFLQALEADAKRPAAGYRGINGLIHGLMEGGCYEGMSLLAAREVAIRVERAVADGRTSELSRCKWLGRHGTPEGKADLEKVFANPKNRAWIEANSPNCLFALDKARAPRAPKQRPTGK